MEEIRVVALATIECNPHQPRQMWDDEELADLAASIKSVGIIHPPVVQLDSGRAGYVLVSGERRVRAARLAGLSHIPVVVRSEDTVFSAQAALIENVQRVDLNPIEVAKALRHLMEQFSYRQEQLASIVGKKRSTVANYLRLLALPLNIQEATASGQITMGHAKAILAVPVEEQQQELYSKIVSQGLSVRAAEKVAAFFMQPLEPKTLSKRDIFLQALELDLQAHFGTKVSIQGTGEQGRIALEYYSLDDLDRLLERLGIKQSDY